MKARITNPLGFDCVRDGELINLKKGSIVSGSIAVQACTTGDAIKVNEPRTETKVHGPTDTKAA